MKETGNTVSSDTGYILIVPSFPDPDNCGRRIKNDFRPQRLEITLDPLFSPPSMLSMTVVGAGRETLFLRFSVDYLPWVLSRKTPEIFRTSYISPGSMKLIRTSHRYRRLIRKNILSALVSCRVRILREIVRGSYTFVYFHRFPDSFSTWILRVYWIAIPSVRLDLSFMVVGPVVGGRKIESPW